MALFHSLQVESVESLTSDAVKVTFGVPETLQADYRFNAGQYVTLKHPADDSVRRAYSICSPSHQKGNFSVGIKQIENGLFSSYANNRIKAGDTLEVMVPEGRFTYEASGKPQHIAAFASGSGITPIMSIAHAVLTGNEQSTFVLVYGNRSNEDTMFLSEIQRLEQKYTDRFFVQHLHSRSLADGALFGRIDQGTVNLIVKNKFAERSFDAFYLCGPEGMIQTVKNTLLENGVAEDQIFFELFTTSDTKANIQRGPSGSVQLKVTADFEDFEIEMPAGKNVLDTVLDADIDVSFSCKGGICSSCMARVTEGKASMVNNQILTDSEIESGLILTCQAHAETDTLAVDFDDV
ncbi:ferredoxin--NADP reductase [Sediminicola luteus]|uniref:Flavodoxin reductase n=1 Tax=Sediminicola luteus TaxID=319238 RepID=A0A2A4GDZ0_9FLAO|nr:ferredoxin--NADP reductase [Sediminicola luteus]PCE66787.1 flavodoxin reductase [Sediminicola luteus]